MQIPRRPLLAMRLVGIKTTQYAAVPRQDYCAFYLSLLLFALFAVYGQAEPTPPTVQVVATAALTSSFPHSVGVDTVTGAVFFTQQHSLQRILTNGTVVLVAGSGTQGLSNGVGGAASFYRPWGIAILINDPSAVFVVDSGNHCLRLVNASTGNVSTYAGLCGTAGGANGLAARFNSPHGVALFHNTTAGVDACLYIADTSNQQIRRVDLATGSTEVFAGTLETSGSLDWFRLASTFDEPYDVTVDATGRWLYVADTFNFCVRRIDALGSSGGVLTFAGTCWSGGSGFTDGVGGSAKFNEPHGITIDASGAVVYVADTANCAIRRINTTNGLVATLGSVAGCGGVALNGLLENARFTRTYGIRYYATTQQRTVTMEGLMVADYTALAIRRIELDTVVQIPPRGTLSMTASHTNASTTASPTVSWSHCGESRTASHTEDTSSRSPTLPLTPTKRSSSFGTVEPSVTTSLGSTSMPSRSRTLSATPQQLSLRSHDFSATGTQRSTSRRSRPASTSWWTCGDHDLRNASIGAAVGPEVLGAALPSFARTLAVVPPLDGEPSAVLEMNAASNSVRLSAAALPRVALLATHRDALPLLLLRLSLSWAEAQRWDVVSAKSGRRDEEALAYATTAATVGQRREINVLLWPPPSSSMGWIEGGLGVYVSTEIVLELGLACAAPDGNVSQATVRVVVPAPGAPRDLAVKVETTVTAVQWTTAVGGPGAGSAVGRVSAVRSMMLCGGSSDGGNNGGASGGGLLGIRVECDDDHSNSVAAAARGAVAGNIGILCGCLALVALLIAVYAAATQVRLRTASLRLGAPSILLPVWVATLPSTAAGAAELLSRSGETQCASDVVTAVVGLLMCGLPFAWMSFVALRLVPQLELHTVVVIAAKPVAPLRRFSRLWIISALRHAFRVNTRWVASSSTTAADGPESITAGETQRDAELDGHIADDDAVVQQEDDRQQRSRHAYLLLHEYRVLWYAGVDAGVLVVSGVLSAVSGIGSYQRLCVGAAAAVAAVYAIQLVVCAVARPFATRFAFVHALMTLALSTASVGLRVGGIVVANSGPANAASLTRQDALATASVACDLCVIGITIVRVLLDGIACGKALASVVREVAAAMAAGGTPRSTATLRTDGAENEASAATSLSLPTTLLHNPVPLMLSSNNDDDDDGDLLFWDPVGNALQPAAAHLRDDVASTPCAMDQALLSERNGVNVASSGGATIGVQQPWASDLMIAFGSLKATTSGNGGARRERDLGEGRL